MKAKAIVPLCLLLLVLGSLAHFHFGYSHTDRSGHAWGSDDAYISYRYAENLVRGQGLVFNAGERVEGYTNLLYVLTAAPLVLIAGHRVYLLCFAVNLLAAILTAYLFHLYLRERLAPTASYLGLLALCLSPLMWLWPSSGLETSVVLLVQVSLWVVIEARLGLSAAGRLRWLAVLTLLSVLLRADGFVFPLSVAVYLLLNRRHGHALAVLIPLVAGETLYLVWRHAYYGSLLPNTFHAKVAASLGDRLSAANHQLGKLCLRSGFCIYLTGLFAALAHSAARSLAARRNPLPRLPFPSFVALALLAYWFYVGGDVFYERFLLVLVPLGIAAVLQLGKAGLSPRVSTPVVCLMLLLQLVPFAADKRFGYQARKYDRWIELGEHLRVAHAGAVLAADAIGKMPFYSGLHTVDMLGLCDEHIARSPAASFNVGHSRYDPAYVLGRTPTLIAAWAEEGLDLKWGLKEDLYRGAGYVPKYAVNALTQAQYPNIVDIEHASRERVTGLIDAGYGYLVLMRAGPAASGR